MNFDTVSQDRPTPEKRRRWLWLAALLVVAIAGGGLAFALLRDSGPPVPVGRIIFSNGEKFGFRSGDPEPAALPLAPGSDVDPYLMALSPQGDRIAFSTYNDDNIYVVNADGSNLVQLTSERDNHAPAWSPDGRQIVFTSWSEDATEPEDDTELGFYVVNADGSGLRRLPIPADLVGIDVDWSPDGQKLAFTYWPEEGEGSTGNNITNTDIAVVNLDGSGFARLTTDQTGESSPVWSPDGSTIAYVVAEEFYAEDEEIWTMAADGSNRRRLTDNDAEDTEPAWSPDGRHLVFERGKDAMRLFVMDADGANQRFLANGQLPHWGP